MKFQRSKLQDFTFLSDSTLQPLGQDIWYWKDVTDTLFQSHVDTTGDIAWILSDFQNRYLLPLGE